MATVERLLENNRTWAAGVRGRDPRFFERLVAQQRPDYLWIGCSDSRVPANEIVGLPPGEMFVHRNVANLFLPGDLNALSTLQFAVDRLSVRHVIVCGHYRCTGVQAALEDARLGIVDNWLRPLRDLAHRHEAALAALPDAAQRADRLGELNVAEQVRNVCLSTVVQDAWARGVRLEVHGWIYAVRDGLIRDLGVTAASRQDVSATGVHPRRR